MWIQIVNDRHMVWYDGRVDFPSFLSKNSDLNAARKQLDPNSRRLSELAETDSLKDPTISELRELARIYQLPLGQILVDVFDVEAPEMVMNQAQVSDMRFLELMGAIFVRSQLIEQVMCQLIQERAPEGLPASFDKWTFGRLLKRFDQLYPEARVGPGGVEDLSVWAWLSSALDARNEAAHGDYLTHLAIHDLMKDYGANISLDRITLRAAQKSLKCLDQAMVEILQFREHAI